jgi:aerobic carbon-monoxide dehydrogenase medium subunit
MKPASFEYHAPKTIDEAVALLARLAPLDGRVLAGGQSLVPIMAFRMSHPAHLIDINGVLGLDRVRVDGDALVIPACVRHAAFEGPVEPGPLGRLLVLVVRHIAHHPIRTRGTFCGSLAHADPSSEWCLLATTLDGAMIAQSVRGKRTLPAESFFAGVMTTALDADELLLEARLPILPSDTRFGFYEVNRRAGDFAMAMALVTYRLKDGKIVEPRVGLGGVEPRPRRIREAEAVLVGRAPGPEAFRAAAEAAATAAKDILEDERTGAEYRRDLARTVVRRALERSAA